MSKNILIKNGVTHELEGTVVYAPVTGKVYIPAEVISLVNGAKFNGIKKQQKLPDKCKLIKRGYFPFFLSFLVVSLVKHNFRKSLRQLFSQEFFNLFFQFFESFFDSLCFTNYISFRAD